MNTTMWEHPATQRNLQQLRSDGVHIVEPDAGEMACGTIGPGRLSEPDRIVAAAIDLLISSTSALDLAGEHVLITVGATREELDPVRFISNRSSGRMGFALADAARSRGADVTVVSGFTTVEPPQGIQVIHASSASDMHAAVMGHISKATIFIAAAAVADYRPVQRAADKIKKGSDRVELALEQTADILADVAAKRSGRLLVIGFAAETSNVNENARKKLMSKNLDVVVANDVTQAGAGFDANTNIISIFTREAG